MRLAGSVYFWGGAWGSLFSPTIRGEVTLTIADARLSDTGRYSVRFGNSCGDGVTREGAAIVQNPCRGDRKADLRVDESSRNCRVVLLGMDEGAKWQRKWIGS